MQHENYSLPKTAEAYALIERQRVHPLLGWRLKEQEAAWENVLDEHICAYLKDHRVANSTVFPASAYVEIALAAAREYFGGDAFELEELNILAPIVFDENHACNLRVELSPREGNVNILSRERLSNDAWVTNATCRLLGAPTRYASITMQALDNTADKITAPTHYKLAHLVGLDYGHDFQGFVSGAIADERLDARLALPQNLNSSEYLLHPVLLDSCFQSLVNFFREDIESGKGAQLLPVKIGRLRYYANGRPAAFRMCIKGRNLRSIRAEFILLDENENTIAVLENCVFRVSVMQHRKEHQPAQWKIISKTIPHPLDEIAGVNTKVIAAQMRAMLAQPELAQNRKTYFATALPLLDALVATFTYEAFLELNGNDADWLQNAISDPSLIPADCRQFFLWLLQVMQQASLLVKENDNWRISEESAPPPAEEIWRSLLLEFPEILPELLFIGRIGKNLAELLAGKITAASLVESVENSYLLEMLDGSLTYQNIQTAQFATLQSIAENWPKNRRLRVLHISKIFNELPEISNSGNIDYVAASTNDENLSHLKAVYQGHASVKIATLNADDMSLKADSNIPQEFDIIMLEHWLYDAANPASALTALQAKMANNGQLIIAERYANHATNFIFGLQQNWWRNNTSSLLAPNEWQAMLGISGFNNIDFISEPADAETQSEAYVIVAQNSKPLAQILEQNARWLLVSDNSEVAKNYTEIISPSLSATILSLDQIQSFSGFDNVVYLPGSNKSRCVEVLHLVQELSKEAKPPKLWMITSGGAVAADAEWKINPQEAALWGFGRVVMNEYPELNCTLIDVASDIDDAEKAKRLANELLAPDGENEIVLNPNARFGLRIQAENSTAAEMRQAARFKLDFQVPGQLRNLLWLEQKEASLKSDEIEVQPAAVGLNFRDVMYAMGMLPDEAVENGFSGPSLGLEFAGTVSRVGSGVREYKAGDAVMGFGPACFSSHIVTTAGAITRKPENWSFAQSATVPTAFFTVYYALKHLANVQPGEKVLIHGAAGGIGIAAIQMAKYLGAEIFATAGSDEKRDFVELLGADHILDSRSLAFADDILALTNGEGVDVVLNSLAGEAINRNLRAIKPFGRFLELGKRDFFENTQIGLRPFKDNISYFGIDADQLLVAKPELAAKLFREMMELFAIGALSPLPYRHFSAEKIVEAFRYMQQSRHIGKIIIDLEKANITVAKPKEIKPKLHLNPAASYLVTGGLAGFGLESACYLARRGAKHLILLSRQGMNTPGAAKVIAGLEKLGCQCHVFACDITNYNALAEVFAAVQKTLPPLRGILHAAMVLDDALIGNLNAERFENVLAPKITGAMNLHNLSLKSPLDYFIVYSSITTALGNPGQSNYVAANAYLEAFTMWRRNFGLPAHCIGWGPIGDAGYLTRNTAVKDNLAAKLGAKPLESKQAFKMLDAILAGDNANIIVGDFSFASLSRLLPSMQTPRFESLQYLNSLNSAESDDGDILNLIAGKSFEEVCQLIQNIILSEVGKILSVTADRIDVGIALNELGMDSLMTVELVLAVEQRFGIKFSAMELSGAVNNIERITKRVAEKLCNIEEKVETDALANLVDMVAGQHEEILPIAELAETREDLRRQAQAISEQAA